MCWDQQIGWPAEDAEARLTQTPVPQSDLKKAAFWASTTLSGYASSPPTLIITKLRRLVKKKKLSGIVAEFGSDSGVPTAPLMMRRDIQFSGCQVIPEENRENRVSKYAILDGGLRKFPDTRVSYISLSIMVDK